MHSSDIMCLHVNTSGDREWAVTGQCGPSPAIFVWNTRTGKMLKRFQLQRDAKSITACSISPDGLYIAVADKSEFHNVNIFNTETE